MVESLQGIVWSDTKSRMAPGYNGLPVGPTLIVRQGDTMKVTLRNSLPPGSDLDKALYAYVRDPASDEHNVTAIVNRISPFGAYVSNASLQVSFIQLCIQSSLMFLYFHSRRAHPNLDTGVSIT